MQYVPLADQDDTNIIRRWKKKHIIRLVFHRCVLFWVNILLR